MMPQKSNTHNSQLQKYYQWHAPLYDLTRWSFLFGRNGLMHLLPPLPQQPHVLEIGCGTGRNIKKLQSVLPDAHITGIDLSSTMLHKAYQKYSHSNDVEFKQGEYGIDNFMHDTTFDLILCSYSLSMMGTQLKPLFQQIKDDLSTNGVIAVVDFHQTSLGWFQQWMQANHVEMNGHLLPLLKQHFKPLESFSHPAYFGAWFYVQFVGKK